MIDHRPDDIDVMEAVRLLRVACHALMAARFKLDDAGYECEALHELYACVASVVSELAGRKPKSVPDPVPDHIVREAIEYRLRQGRSY